MPRLRFPHPLVLLFSGVILAAALTWIVPAGQFDRRHDPDTDKDVVIKGTYHSVPRHPVGPFGMVVDLPRGMIDAADIIFFVFLVGGAFTVVDETGALRRAVDWLADKLQDRRVLVIPVICLVFAAGGALENLQEEILAMVPVLLLLCRRLGYDPLTAAAMSIGAASVGSAFSPVNPFQAVIAQKLAQLGHFSGWQYRLVFMALALGSWIWWTIRHAEGTRRAGRAEEMAEADGRSEQVARLGGRQTTIILTLVVLAFVTFITGVLRYNWDFSQMAAVFFVMGVATGLIGKLGVNGTAEAFVKGFQSMAYAAILIGFARAIFVVMEDGHVVDTLVSAMFRPLVHLPVAASAVGMMLVQTILHFPVPSVSGQAALTMPVLVPLADLLHLSRQVVVLAFQYGAGICELITPTNGALMAIIGAAKVRYEDWLRFVWPLYLLLAALGVVAILLGVAIGLR